MIFSAKFEDSLRRAQMGYDSERFFRMAFLFSLLVALVFAAFVFLLMIRAGFNIMVLALTFAFSFIGAFFLISLIPGFAVQNRKAMLESDLLYSTRHLLLKLQSGSSLLNSIDSAASLKNKSSQFFKEIMFDISLGMPIEEALEKAIEYSPSKAYTTILEEIKTSLTTGADLQEALKSTLRDMTKQHLIAIQEYGKKLNPMSMFYMIIGTMTPSLGVAMLVVVASLLPTAPIVDFRLLMFMAAILLVVQVFFILAFKSIKPAVME